MKKFFKLAAVASALAFSANLANASDKIGFINSGFLVQNHPLAVEAEQKFMKFMKDNQAKFDAENKALADDEKKLLAERNKFAEKEKALIGDNKKFEAEVQKFQKDQAALDSAIKAKQAELDRNDRLSTKQKNAELEKAFNKRIADIQSRGASLQKRQAEFAKKAEPLQKEAAAFQKKVEEFEKKRKAFQDRVNKANKEANGFDPNEIQQKVIKNIDETIRKVAKEKGFTIVLPIETAPVYVADESAELTEAVFVAMGGKLPEQPKEAAKSENAAEQPKAEEVKSEQPQSEPAKPAEAK